MQSRRTPLAVFLVALIALALQWLTVACSGPQRISPQYQWVTASRAVHDVLAPRLQVYLQADPALDPETRTNLLRVVDDWEFMIRQAEAVVGSPVAAPAQPTPAPSTPISMRRARTLPAPPREPEVLDPQLVLGPGSPISVATDMATAVVR